MTTTLHAPPKLWETIRADLLSTPEVERAAVGYAGIAADNGNPRLLLRDWSSLDPGDYLVQLGYHLEVSPTVWARAAKRARESGEALIVMHSHPQGTAFFSASDDAGEHALVPKLHARAPTPVGSVVIAPDSLATRVWHPGARQAPLALKLVGARGNARSGPQHPDEFFERQVRALTREGQAVLHQLRIGVVGAGGLGAHVIQQLAHLGVGELVVVDHDRVARSNLSRLVGARRRDVWLRTKKVKAAKRLVRAIGSPTVITPIDGDVTDESTARELLACDLIVGCTDNHWSRMILNALAYQYYVPVLDLGVEIQPGGSSGGRISWLAPGSACLWCRNVLSAERVRVEQLPAAIRRAEQERGYIRDADEPAPAVVSINGVIASLAVTELLARATGFAGDGARPNFLLYRIADGTVRRVSGEAQSACPTCSASGALGAGDLVSAPWRSSA